MNDAERERLSKKWLDAALRQGADAEPRPGLEARILANLAAKRQRQPQPWWRAALNARAWGTALAALVLIAAAVTVSRREHRKPEPSAATVRLGPTTPLHAPTAITEPERTVAAKGPNGAQREHGVKTALSRVRTPSSSGIEPQVAQFPAPTPLSDQEKLLLQYLQRTPKSEVVAVATEDQQYRGERVREMEALLRTPER